jgi:hypothetical protein
LRLRAVSRRLRDGVDGAADWWWWLVGPQLQIHRLNNPSDDVYVTSNTALLSYFNYCLRCELEVGTPRHLVAFSGVATVCNKPLWCALYDLRCSGVRDGPRLRTLFFALVELTYREEGGRYREKLQQARYRLHQLERAVQRFTCLAHYSIAAPPPSISTPK